MPSRIRCRGVSPVISRPASRTDPALTGRRPMSASQSSVGPFSGYVSYSNERGNGYFPVTGGLFLGDAAAQANSAGSRVFPVSQDERNAVRTRFRWDVTPRLWAAIGGTYDSGLPIDFDGTYQEAAAQYGQAILNRVNFSDYRPFPLVSLDRSEERRVGKACR